MAEDDAEEERVAGETDEGGVDGVGGVSAEKP